MQPALSLRCPGCNARIKAPVQLLGQTRPCPGCGQSLLIEVSAPPDAGPVLVEEAVVTAPERTVVRAEEALILVVDDDRELNDGLRSLLEKQGHRVVQAFDGVQAKALVREEKPDLMILDMVMPRLGGYPVLEYLQEKPEAPPVIMITAKEGNQHRVYAEYLGVVDYLTKPFAIGRFLESVERGLARKGGQSSGTMAG